MAREQFGEMLTVGGKTNALGRADEVIAAVLDDRLRLNELYQCMFSDDPWVRMRAADAFEKVCRQHPVWIEPYIDKMQTDLSGADQQASIQWHIAQIYRQVTLTARQKGRALSWLTNVLSSSKIDWIVAANAMQTLVHFAKQGDVARKDAIRLCTIQLHHTSKAVVKKAHRYIDELRVP